MKHGDRLKSSTAGDRASTSNLAGRLATAPQLAGFRALCQQASGHPLRTASDLHAFSIEQPELFWRTLLDWSELPWSGSADTVLVGDDVETAQFFPHLRLNYAEALLRRLPDLDDEAPAVVSLHIDRAAERLTRRELRQAVAAAATALASEGITVGTPIMAVGPNNSQFAVAILAAVALGATVATAAPDIGTATLINRFEQMEPAWMLIDRTQLPGGIEEGTTALLAGLPSVRQVVVLDEEALLAGGAVPAVRLSDSVGTMRGDADTEWPRLPFNHPQFVMFSSGTTGPPKAIVHTTGGVLLEHIKEHRLHGDLRPDDTLYFHTSTAWMMWNWQLSALAVGACIVLYDGPALGPAMQWEIVADERVTVFGTSSAYLQLCQDAGYRPAEAVDLVRLRAVLSTGGVLHDWQFDWLAQAVGPQPLQSISGGTDILGCFVLGHPEVAVRVGRCQARSLGLDVAAVDERGTVVVGRVGELVCRKPFPSRPIGFLRDPDGSRFHAAYFADHAGMWSHGDLAEFDPDGSARIHGRSDGVLNVNGIRIGPSEIYIALRRIPEIADAMAVEQRDPDHHGQSRMVLLVVLSAGATLDGALHRMIRRTLRQHASPAHVPSVLAAVPELPITHNGKRSERAARDAVNGERIANETALRNPACLRAIQLAVGAAGLDVPGDPSALKPLFAAGIADPPVEDAPPPSEALSRMWCEILGVPDARPEDNFLDLGGSSREIVRLLRRVKLEVAADVPLVTFLEDPTLRGLAHISAAAHTKQTAQIRLLRSGAGRPIFVACDMFGQFNEKYELVQALDTQRPIYGVQPSLVDDHGRRRTIADLTEDVATLVLAVQPSGPFTLTGYSFGGLLAYETACRLTAGGHPVAFVGLIDVVPPKASLSPRTAMARRWAARLQVREWLRQRWDRRSLSRSGEWEALMEVRETYDAHVLSPYSGAVTYYLAERTPPLVGNALAAWRRAAPHLLVTQVPAGHDDMLAQPHVRVLADRLSTTLH
jgi:acetoacetyl-CoA synthetase